jgi:hypothetical protein
VEHLGVEDLPGELPRLLEGRAAVLRVGEAVEVGALVDEAPAVGVDEDAEGIAVLLELVADGELAELGRVPVPAAGSASPLGGRVDDLLDASYYDSLRVIHEAHSHESVDGSRIR